MLLHGRARTATLRHSSAQPLYAMPYSQGLPAPTGAARRLSHHSRCLFPPAQASTAAAGGHTVTGAAAGEWGEAERAEIAAVEQLDASDLEEVLDLVTVAFAEHGETTPRQLLRT